ncbi:hypothetical protein [Streptomyces sp. WZ-12]|uniref:hypothetical protein n=1 Tax=Streptomyces sp. WZ-12 TaxID=3030210 RepID=UPI0023819284|nr:hypothetical protein [Streptomyces sp. WZ-12]
MANGNGAPASGGSGGGDGAGGSAATGAAPGALPAAVPMPPAAPAPGPAPAPVPTRPVPVTAGPSPFDPPPAPVHPSPAAPAPGPAPVNPAVAPASSAPAATVPLPAPAPQVPSAPPVAQAPAAAPLPPVAPAPAPGPAPGSYGRAGMPARTPVSVPLLPPELADGQPRPRRGDPLPRRAGRALRRVFASSPAAESAALTRAASAIQQPVSSGRQIAVSSIRGGAGKSTVAALLALTFAHYRPDPVLAVEADPALGTLPHRLGAREVRWSGSDLAQILDPSMLITDLTGYLLPFAGGGWLLPGSQGAIGTRLDIDAYRVLMTSLRRHFAATVVDCETLPAEVARTALVTTQARVLVTPATPEGVAATRSVLDWIGGLHPGLLPTAVVVLTHSSPDSGVDVRKAAAHLGAGGAAVLPLPYDRHLAAGGAIRTELLGARTREAAARIAAEVMHRAVSRDPSRRQQQQQQHQQPQQHRPAPPQPPTQGTAPYAAPTPAPQGYPQPQQPPVSPHPQMPPHPQAPPRPTDPRTPYGGGTSH